jgi:hypothetical protein
MNAARKDITRRSALDALGEYLKLREELGALEARDNECQCEDFYRCGLCTETRDKAHRTRGLIELWGDNWAVMLQELIIR